MEFYRYARAALEQAVEIPRPIRHDIATLIPRREDCMRGADSYNESLFSTVTLEEFVPQTHPLGRSGRG
ncbi:hypothetical protein BCC0238_005959 [Burkholderia gladioli]|jgi:hypothetical protein